MVHPTVLDNHRCPICRSIQVTPFIDIPNVPVHCNLLWGTSAEAVRAPRGDIRLGFCRSCGHVYNLAFDPELMKYNQAYENSLHFSPRFQGYAEALARDLITGCDLHGKQIIEIGCGQGDFLRMLCDLGGNYGLGFDPSYVPKPDQVDERVRFIQDYYSEAYLEYQADFICSRHVLEHIDRPLDFLTMLRRTTGDRLNTIVFFEVPNVLFSLRELGIWDLIYEHYSYFSASSLSRLFTLCGFRVAKVFETFGGQFLCIQASPAGDGRTPLSCDTPELNSLSQDVETFTNKYVRKVETWRRRLDEILESGQRAVVWGAGSKGVTLLNILSQTHPIEYVIDINPRKQGMYVSGTGQKIQPPEYLQTHRPDIVILMNPIYKEEIRSLVRNLGLEPEFWDA